ncbi:MAG: cystathionine gamma-synthase [Rhodobacteraceae bacterium]|nr:cystathionine gamma-synthase [Paracoccaceae bacterium]
MTDALPPRSLARRPAAPSTVTRPVASPIQPSVVWRAEDADALDAQYEGRTEGFAYARESHPNAVALARQIDALEGTPEGSGGGLCFGSGMGAVSAVLLGLLKSGDRVIASSQLYGRSLRLMTQDLPRFGIEIAFVDPTDGAAWRKAAETPAAMVFAEVVSNPTLRVADMDAARDAATACGGLLVVDNTFTTPRGWRPFEHGADIVIHSVTKMLAGHSDATLGWAAARTPEIRTALAAAQGSIGATASPFDCWLAERGLATFALRYDRAEANAAALADHLATLPGVEAAIYPGRADHPDHNRAGDLLQGRNGTMVAFRLKGGRAQANAFIRAAADLPFAPSLGDVQTLLSHPPSSSHRALTPEGRAALGITEGFIRVSVGVEEIETLKAEFSEAVAAAAKV